MLHPQQTLTVDDPMRRKIAQHLSTNYLLSASEALKHVPFEMVQWGKLRQASNGDVIHAAELVQRSEQSSPRDATFVKVSYVFSTDICSKYLILF